MTVWSYCGWDLTDLTLDFEAVCLSPTLCNVKSGFWIQKERCGWIFKILTGFVCFSTQLRRCCIFCLEQSDNIQFYFSQELNSNQEWKNALGNKSCQHSLVLELGSYIRLTTQWEYGSVGGSLNLQRSVTGVRCRITTTLWMQSFPLLMADP